MIWSLELVPVIISSVSLPVMANEKLLGAKPRIPLVISVVIVAYNAISDAIIAGVLSLLIPYKY